jgi:hypothetical protein
MKNFLIKLSLFALLIGMLDYCWIYFTPVEKHIPHVWIIIIFFILATATFHFLSVNASKGKPQGFIHFHMSSTAIRLMVYLFIIIAYRFFDKSTTIPFALGFMIHYFFFTFFDVFFLIKHLGK